MLYQDSKAKLLRAQEDKLKIPAACTFQPRLSSNPSPSRRRGRPFTTKASALSPEGPDEQGKVGGDAYVLAKSAARYTSKRVDGLREDECNRDNGSVDDDSQAWVNRLAFDDGNEGDQTNNNDNNNHNNSDNNDADDHVSDDVGDDDHEGRTEENRPEEQHQDDYHKAGNHRYHHRGYGSPTGTLSSASEEGGQENYGDRGSGGAGGSGGRSVEGRGGDGRRKLKDWSAPAGHHLGRSLSSRRLVTQRGLSEGAGQRRRAAAVAVADTLSYAERLYRSHEEQHQVWARRRQERARLELKGCTFRPRLKKQPEDRGRAGTTYPREGLGREARRWSSSVVTFKSRMSPEEDSEEETSGSATSAAAVAAAAAAHERLYLAAEVARARRAEEVAEKKRAETAGCTFQPAVNRATPAAAAVAAPTLRGQRRTMLHGKETACRSSGSSSSSGGRNSVFDRLLTAGREAAQRKAMLGKMPPAGCTFRPQVRKAVNGYARPTRHAISSALATTTAAPPPPPPRPQQPPPHPYLHPRGVGELDSPRPPPPP
ncbi:unnamed protein product, partial [Hapterophycus canaliculatus]